MICYLMVLRLSLFDSRHTPAQPGILPADLDFQVRQIEWFKEQHVLWDAKSKQTGVVCKAKLNQVLDRRQGQRKMGGEVN